MPAYACVTGRPCAALSPLVPLHICPAYVPATFPRPPTTPCRRAPPDAARGSGSAGGGEPAPTTPCRHLHRRTAVRAGDDGTVAVVARATAAVATAGTATGPAQLPAVGLLPAVLARPALFQGAYRQKKTCEQKSRHALENLAKMFTNSCGYYNTSLFFAHPVICPL